MSAKTKRKAGYNAGTTSIVFIVLAFVVVMSIQIYKLKIKDDQLKEREQNLQQQLAEEEQRATELDELEKEVNSVEYIIEMGHKMGLVFENEIIFKESGE